MSAGAHTEALTREGVITSVLNEDPQCFVEEGYTRHHLSDEPHGQNLALKFEMSH